MNSDTHHSRWSNPALIAGFNLGIGYLLNEYCGHPHHGRSWVPSALFAILLAIAALAIIVGGVRLARREQSKADRVISTLAIGLVAVFVLLDPPFNMNQSPLHCVISLIGFGCGCLAAAEASQRRLNSIGIGCMLFWLAVAWIVWANYDYLQYLGGKWGVGIIGGWKS